jgi:hypothetical protein
MESSCRSVSYALFCCVTGNEEGEGVAVLTLIVA